MFGGKWMDTFMDKLAQKLTAQEMIKANAAADAEEMKKLQMQIDEYRKILDKMQALLDNAQVDGGAINRLVEESVAKIEQIQADTQGYDKLQESVTEFEGSLGEKLTALDENIHKECVKVYRNVQAVVVEESEKQKEALESTKERVSVLGGKLKLIVGLAAGTLAVSVIGLALQIISMLNIKLF